MGKGNARRPSDVPKEQYDKNWERIFNQPVKKSDKKRTENGHAKQ